MSFYFQFYLDMEVCNGGEDWFDVLDLRDFDVVGD